MKHQTLLITGVTGFLGGHMTLEALRQGHTVRGTLRSMKRAASVRAMLAPHLGEAAEKTLERLTFHEADLLAPEGWRSAAAGCDAALHVASPFPLTVPKDEQEVIGPARMGLKHVFEACAAEGVNRFVHTSSTVAIVYGHGRQKTAFTEADWTRLDGDMMTAYIKSKTLAEQDVWMMAKQQPHMTVSAVNPGFILGPILDQKDAGTSGDVVLKMMRGELPGVPQLGYPTVDVRDVVDLHFLVLNDDKADGQRFAATANTLPFRDLAKALKAAFPKKGRKVGTLPIPNFLLRLFAVFDPSLRVVLAELGYMATVSSDLARQRYGWKPRPAEEAGVAAAQSLIDLGYLD
ncbi:NAD-dependent epimerase/dehydratase family protein [Flavobacteriales bacterium]|nr:NAD-dependent epimerase/dehydratase family protein [Flavobacteriales bacterium]